MTTNGGSKSSRGSAGGWDKKKSSKIRHAGSQLIAELGALAARRRENPRPKTKDTSPKKPRR